MVPRLRDIASGLTSVGISQMSSSGRRVLLAGLLDFEVLQTLSSLFSSLLPSTDSDRRPFLSAAADVKRTAAAAPLTETDGRPDRAACLPLADAADADSLADNVSGFLEITATLCNCKRVAT